MTAGLSILGLPLGLPLDLPLPLPPLFATLACASNSLSTTREFSFLPLLPIELPISCTVFDLVKFKGCITCLCFEGACDARCFLRIALLPCSLKKIEGMSIYFAG